MSRTGSLFNSSEDPIKIIKTKEAMETCQNFYRADVFGSRHKSRDSNPFQIERITSQNPDSVTFKQSTYKNSISNSKVGKMRSNKSAFKMKI